MNGLSVCVSGAVPSEALLHHLLHACMGLMVAAAKGGTHVPKNHPFDAQLLEINIEYRSTASGISISDLIRPSSNHVPKNIKYQYVLEHGPCSPLQP